MNTLTDVQTMTTASGSVWQFTPAADGPTMVESWTAGTDPENDPPRDRFYIDQVELLGVDADRVRLHIQTTADGVVFSDPFRRDLHGPSHVTTSPVARTAIPPAAQPAG